MDLPCEYGVFKDVFIISNQNLNQYFQNYSFLYVKKELDLSIYKKIDQSIKKSPFIIVNNYKEQINQIENLYFIICFEQTIIIVNQSLLFHLSNIFSNKTDLKICFLSDNECDFNQKIEINYQKIEYDRFMENHEYEFYESLSLCKTAKASIKNIWSSISRCLSVYLIKQSLNKLNKNRFENFDYENTNENTKIISKDEYVKLDLIGSGSVSNVSLIYYLDTKELLAIKDLTNDVEEDKLLKREKENYKKLHHPLLPKFYGITQKNDFIIIEYIQGKTLLYIKKLRLNEIDKINIIFQLILVIEYLHRNHFIYRDLKPNNVLIDENKTIVLIDFDRMIDFDNASICDVCTKNWESVFIAPELYKDDLSYKCDIYSLGLMFYFILFENYPTYDNKNEIIKSLESLNKIGKIFCDCLNEDPKKRPTIYQLIHVFYCAYCNSIKDKHLLEYYNKYLINNSELMQYNNHSISKNINVENYYDIGLIYKMGINVQKDINKAIYYFSLASDQNDPRAQFELGSIFHKSEYVERDINKALKYYTLAANQNHPRAQFNLGFIYDEAKYVKRDINKAIKYYTLAANQNHSIAQYNLGLIYDEANYVERDISKAIYYYTLAANQGICNAQFILGLIYDENKYVKRNINKAIKYYTLAANQGYSDAQFKLYLLYAFDNECAHDEHLAMKYLESAAKQNHKNAKIQLGQIYCNNGILYLYGSNVQHDIKKAINYLTLASELNNQIAQFNLGCIYINPQYCLKDTSKSIYYFKLASYQNHPTAQLYLGMIYSNPQNKEYDINLAIHYYTLAANQKNEQAQYDLGYLYYNGEKVKRNVEKALLYFELAANQDYDEALFYLGDIYYRGKHVNKDIPKSLIYLKRAANKNNAKAQFLLGKIYHDGIYEVTDIEKAIFYFKKAANQNISNAQFNLGVIYLNEKYKKRNINEAKKYFLLAANQNNPNAQACLGHIYCYGIDCQPDINKAIHFYTQAKNQHHPEAEYQLGLIYSNDKLCLYDLEKCVSYMTLAANQNHQKAQFTLGHFFTSGILGDQYINRGIDYLLLSLKNGHVYANFEVGYLYHEGKKIKQDIQKAIHYYKDASSFNNQYAKNNLGIIYKNGFGSEIQKDVGKAIIYFKEAIHQSNDSTSMFNLSSLYVYDNPIENCIDESIKYLIKLSMNGFHFSEDLLCIALIKKFGFDYNEIMKHISNYKEVTGEFANEISQRLKNAFLSNCQNYNLIYQRFKDVDFYYDSSCQIELSKKLIEQKANEVQQEKKVDIPSISKSFYEGFGLDL